MAHRKYLLLALIFGASISANSLFGQTVSPAPGNGVTPQTVAQSAPTDDTVIVTARRTLRAWRGQLQTRRTQAVCRTTTTSGNPEIDQIACNSMVVCWTRSQPELAAIKAMRVSRAEKQQLTVPVNAQLSSCIAAENERGVQALAN